MKILFVLTALFVSLNALAATSEENRADKTWGIVGQLGNFTLGGKSTFGLGLGGLFYVNANNVLSVEIGSGTNFDFLSSFSGDTVNSQDWRLGFYDKAFFSNSFYLKYGLEGNQVHYSVTHYPVFGTNYNQTANINVYTAYFGVGNHWQINGMTIGCDWFGLQIPLTTSNFSETDTGYGSLTWDLSSRLKSVSGIATRFYMGASF
jgi:hypothetical protein